MSRAIALSEKSARSMKRLTKNSTIDAFSLTDVDGNVVRIPQKDKIIHLQFRRFSACPFCSVHMGQLKKRKTELDESGLVEVLLFYSENKHIKDDIRDIPFAIVADPKRFWYDKFGVERSILGLLNPSAWLYGIKGFFLKIRRILHMLPNKGESLVGLPAEFLIDADGKLLEVKYGVHAYDQWSVDALLEMARSHKKGASTV